MKVKLFDYNTGLLSTPAQVVGVCRQKKCTVQTIQQCLQEKPQPHLSVLEFMWFCFHLEDIPIRVLWQLVRHRQFSFMFKSSRHNGMLEVIDLSDISSDVDRVIAEVLLDQEDILDAEGAEVAGWLQTMAHTTELYLAGNGRVFYEYLQKRMCNKHVLPIHFNFAHLIYHELHVAVPEVYNNKLLPCNSCRVCQGEGR